MKTRIFNGGGIVCGDGVVVVVALLKNCASGIRGHPGDRKLQGVILKIRFFRSPTNVRVEMRRLQDTVCTSREFVQNASEGAAVTREIRKGNAMR